MMNRLETLLVGKPGTLAIAVSGGVDSLTLMTVADRVRQTPTIAVHAISPAVPADASERVRALAAERGWTLREIQPGEFDDPDYVANPLNRCYFCKNSLFAGMQAALPDAVLATGTNLDDLGDFRPGLKAAQERAVWQPFITAEIGKDAIRAIARAEGLPEIAALPAQPCLASRIETGIAVRPDDLAFLYEVEQMMTARLGPGDHRCRITRAGVVAQTPPNSGILAEGASRTALETDIAALCTRFDRPFARLEAYRKGSAFLQERS